MRYDRRQGGATSHFLCYEHTSSSAISRASTAYQALSITQKKGTRAKKTQQQRFQCKTQKYLPTGHRCFEIIWGGKRKAKDKPLKRTTAYRYGRLNCHVLNRVHQGSDRERASTKSGFGRHGLYVVELCSHVSSYND